jgi:autotransporter-associated beta strand protein
LVGNANLNVADGAAVADLTISGSVTNAGTLTKSGDGKLVLQGLSTYTSNTTVNAGTLELKDDARLTFVIPASGASNKISGAGTAEFNGDFLINTTAAAALATGTWTLEDVTGTATYGTSFQVVNSDGSPWTSSGGTWTKVSGSQLWTYDKTSGVLTLAVAGYEAWASQIGDSNQRDREDDPDTDGFTNIQEFLFGTNPTTNTGSLTSMTSDGSFLTIRWSERTSGAGYQLLESATLANPWVLSGTTPSNDGPAVGDYQPRKAEVTIVAGKNFFRVEGVEN